MILKSYIVEQNLNILKKYQATLVYGENDGIKDDVKDGIKSQNKNSEIIVFFENEILNDKNILYQNIVNESLFSEEKIIFIHEASDKIINHIVECVEIDKVNIRIYIFSQNLDKKSKLRNLFEKNKNLAILPCYRDNERSLVAYINKELIEFKGLSGEIIDLIITNSNMDRRVIKNEIMKIKDFFLNKKIIKNEILEILNLKNNTNFEEIRDSALNGQKKRINKLLSEVNLLNEDAFFYINIINYRVLKLQEIIRKSKEQQITYVQTLESLKPPVFWKDKPIVIEQLKKWNLEGLNKLATKIGDVEVLMKKNFNLRNDVVIKDLIINLTNSAS